MVEEAKKTPAGSMNVPLAPGPLVTEPVIYSFELNTDMLAQLHEEFNADKIAAKFAQAIKGKGEAEVEDIAKQIFEEYGRDWMKKSLELGEKYPDRTYEVLKAIIEQTGGYYKFSLLPQRFIEIAYLSINEFTILPIVENNANRLIYKLVDCSIYKALKEKCGDKIANLMPCRHACLTACETAHHDLEVDALITMDATMVKDGYCQFRARKA